jgi:hypothetical protein
VQVDVHGVDAEVAGLHAPDDGVEVGAVRIEVRARGVGQACDLEDVALEQAAGVRVGDHDRGDLVGELGLQVTQVHAAVLGLGDLGDGVADEGGGGRVRSVRGRRHQHGAAVSFACGFVGGLDAEQAAEFAVRAGLGRERHGGHPGQRL